MGELSDEEYEAWLQELIDDGSIKAIHDGYIQFNWEVFDLLHPTLARTIMDDQMSEVDEAIANLVRDGFLQMGFEQTPEGGLQPVYSLTDKGRAYVEGM